MNIAALELWALRSLAIAAAVGFICWRVYAAGEAHVQAKWDAHETQVKIQTEVLSAKNRLESTNRQNDVLVAEAAAGQAQRDLANYRRAHPVSVSSARGMCPEADADTARACQGAGNSKEIAACQTARILQQRITLDSKWKRLDALMGEADSINDDYSICLATRPKEP